MEHPTQAVVTSDGVRISLDWYGQGAHPTAVVICPGFFQSKDTVTFRRMSESLAQTHDVVAMDFRGHGRSSGVCTFSASERHDLEAVLQWAQRRYHHLGVLGFSLGAATAINTVSRHPEKVTTVIAVSAPAAFEDIELQFWTPEAMRIGIQGLEPGAGCRPGNPLLKKERPLETIRHVAPIPVLFIHGTNDVIVGIEHSRRLYAAASEPKRFDIVPNGRHAEALFRDDPEHFLGLVRAWFSQTLRLG